MATADGLLAMVEFVKASGTCAAFSVQRQSDVTADPQALTVFQATLTQEDVVLALGRSTPPLLVRKPKKGEAAEPYPGWEPAESAAPPVAE
eukprot:5804572-Prymnesium_polylepis.1